MNLSKVLKKKRDAEDRLRKSSPQTFFADDGTTQAMGAAPLHNHDGRYSRTGHNHDEVYVKIGTVVELKYYEPITNGDSENPEILFHNGDIIMSEVI